MLKEKSSIISATEVEHLAKLARIELSAEQQKNFSNQLTDILKYVKKLSAVDTKNIPPTSYLSLLKNITRRDEIKPNTQSEKLIAAAPEKKDGCVKVKAVLK